MDAMAIAIQQLSVQSAAMQGLNGVVGNTMSGDTGFIGAQQSSNAEFATLIQTLLQNNLKVSGAQLLTKKGEDNAQILAAQMLAQNPLLAALLAQNGFNGEQAEQLMAQAVQSGAPVAMLQGVLQSQNVPQNEQEMILQAIQNQPNGENFVAAVEAELKAATQKSTPRQQTSNTASAEIKNLLKDVEITASQKQPIQAAQLFEQANVQSAAQRARVNTVQLQADESKQAENEKAQLNTTKNEPLKQSEKAKASDKSKDIGQDNESLEALAQQSFKGKIENTITPIKPQTAEAKASQEIIAQTSDGIKQNLAVGKSEFVMKLKPEGLGEITVKLENNNGRMTLQLTAQNSNVQKILESEIEALRQAVKPYSIEVREVATSSNTGFDMNLSSHTSQQQANQNPFNQMNGHFTFQDGSRHHQAFDRLLNGDTDDIAQELTLPAQTMLSTALDTYI